MDKIEKYNQRQASIEEQIASLRNEGLCFINVAKAEHLLSHISLFRIKSYLQPLRVKYSRRFIKGASFEQAYHMYKFDARLRKMICSELEKIEISIRTKLSLTMAENNPFWFEAPEMFKNKERHDSLLVTLQAELHRSDDEQIVGFRQKYSNAFPPSWMTMEISSFGTLSMLYRWLKNGRSRREVAQCYGISDNVLESWLHSIVYVRNICAHHSRLWNKNLRIQPVAPKSTNFPFLANPAPTNRVYYILSIILYLLQVVNPQNTFASRIKSLLMEFPLIDISSMGFPKDWEKELLWN